MEQRVGTARERDRTVRERARKRAKRAARLPHTFVLDGSLVERARREVGERDVVRSIEAALAAAIDYRSWVREVHEGKREPLS